MWTSSRWSLTKKVWATQKLAKITGRVNILLRIFEKIAKKLKMKLLNGKTSFLLNYSKTFKNCAFLDPVTSIWNFLQFSQKCARVYRPFLSTCYWSNFNNSFFWKFEKLNSSAIYKSIVIFFSVNLPLVQVLF